MVTPSSTAPPTSPRAAAPREATSTALPFHAIDSDAVLAAVESSREGLRSEEAEERRRQFGPNVLPRGKRDGALTLLWRQIHNPLIWVLIASGSVAMLADWEGEGIKNGVVILAVVVINALIGFVQEFRASKAIEALSQMVPENVTLLRDGRQETVSATELVPGDLVLVSPGERVPADLRILSGKNVQIEEAMLTGESVAVAKHAKPVAEDADLGDRGSMAFAGTVVTSGTGTGVVVATGSQTELGKISALLHEATDLETPLTRALAEIGKTITIGILVVTAVMLTIGVVRTVLETGESLFEAFRDTVIFAIALAVGAIPEGLPAIVTIALAIGVQRMAARRAIVRKLPAVETLGSTTVICSDKTGTLTRNEMTVRVVWTPEGRYELSGVGYEPRGAAHRDGQPLDPPADLRELLEAGVLCADATLRHENGLWTISGDPTEGALVVAAEKCGQPADQLRNHYPRLDVIPFESERGWMATLHKTIHGDSQAVVKGAPERILDRCEGSPVESLHEEVHAMAAQGMRVLAVAVRSVSGDAIEVEDVDHGLRLLGLVGMIDPPREEAVRAVEVCRAAGITVKMITGDHHATAAAIGAQIGILNESGAVVGAALARMDDEELLESAERVNVFARVAPEHKLRLVRALQSRSHVVAMTGDGANDAPALKQANIGVAMGITGTAASKQAADVVLTDDNFASIGAAVEEGRRVYDNLVKSLAFVLPTNLGLALILLCAVAFFPFDAESGELLLALSPLQLLWINLVATVSLALPLAFEALEPDVMQRPPRRPGTPVLSRFMLIRTAVVASLMTAATVGVFLWEYHGDLAEGATSRMALAEAQTVAVTTIILFQCFYLASCRSLKHSFLAVGIFTNKVFYLGIAAVLILQAVFIYLPAANTLFGSAPLSFDAWMKAVIVGAIVLPIIALEKLVIRPLSDPNAEASA
ncbi:cation-translocating P-type ATPase [Candidatus Laterigemmans baculatus]|uniref:cation-translocating P-type ATPase n=1 Tax=Candidatus Laterigemmans baculatus TaxID=2770505 RepID=UPI0013DB8A64|nr:HAD-IC family P-type ATPase [Candidatus Laterigemmans baculatus]